jgi:hypothetical protein
LKASAIAKIRLILAALIAGVVIAAIWRQNQIASAPPKPIPPDLQPTFTQTIAAGAALSIVTIPAGSPYLVRASLAPTVSSVKDFAAEGQAIAAINAGFFDPNNAKTTSYVFMTRQLVGDPTQNERLTENPKLQPYLKQIFNRSEFRRYQCSGTVRYAIARRQDDRPQGCQLIDAVGGGPRLLPELTAIEEAFLDLQNHRDAIGINQRNARSAVGITPEGTVLLVMAAQKPDGISLPELATVMKQLGAEQALNLDGGTSSALFYQGKVIYGKVDESGKVLQRPVKSVLWVAK